ncbi:MAG: hypothetical protein QXX55_01465 [Candidatus Pacearchaeota archaeon]
MEHGDRLFWNDWREELGNLCFNLRVTKKRMKNPRFKVSTESAKAHLFLDELYDCICNITREERENTYPAIGVSVSLAILCCEEVIRLGV